MASPLLSIFMLIYDGLGGVIYDKNLTTASIFQRKISQLIRKVGLFSTIQEVHNKFKNYKYSQIHFKLLNTDTLLPGICLASLNLKSKKANFSSFVLCQRNNSVMFSSSHIQSVLIGVEYPTGQFVCYKSVIQF